MKRALLITLLGVLSLTTGCSKDDMANDVLTAEATAETTTNILAKGHAMCTDLDQLKLDCASTSVNAPVTFTWNNTKLSYVFNRVYKSYIQIESHNCGANYSTVNIPVHFFSSSSYTLEKGRNETCFKYRVVILGYDKGQLACESMSPWQVFDYSKEMIPAL